VKKEYFTKYFLYPKYKKYNIAATVALLLFALGFLFGWLAGTEWTKSENESFQGKEMRLIGYDLINPLLECEVAKDTIEYKEIKPFKKKVEELIRIKTDNYKLSHVSVYFRDLNNGPWFGINEKEKFAPASLLKVPTMISYLKQAEDNPGLLAQQLKCQGDTDYNAGQFIKPSKFAEHGKFYTIEELIYISIVYSDNNANVLLFNNIDTKVLSKTYTDLGVELPLASSAEDFMPVKSYASFFRILFNASYLSKEMSGKALKYLSETEYKEGIAAGVPSNMVVAHKFGERISEANNEIKQLHDCGIIYYPKHPYLLCIMSRGDNFATLDDIIKDISKSVYEELDSQYRAN